MVCCTAPWRSASRHPQAWAGVNGRVLNVFRVRQSLGPKYRPAWRFNPAVLTTTPSIASPSPHFQQHTGGGGASRGGGGAQPPPPPPAALLAANALSPRRSAANGQQTGLAPAKTCARRESFRCKHHRPELDSTAQQHARTVAHGTIFRIQPHIAHRPHVRRTLARNAERHLRSFLGGSYCASHTAVQCTQGAPVHVQSALRNHTSERVTQSLRCTRGRTTSAARLTPPHAGQVPPTAGHLQSASDVRATATRSCTLGGGVRVTTRLEQQRSSIARANAAATTPSHTAECGAQWTCPGANACIGTGAHYGGGTGPAAQWEGLGGVRRTAYAARRSRIALAAAHRRTAPTACLANAKACCGAPGPSHTCCAPMARV